MGCQRLNRESPGGLETAVRGGFRGHGVCGTARMLADARTAFVPESLARFRVGSRSRRGKLERIRARASSSPLAAISSWCPALLLLLCAAASADSAEDYFWELIRGCTTVAGTNSYLGRYPQGKYVDQARQCLPRLQEEQAAWERIESCQSRQDVEKFLRDYVKGAYWTRAQECLERLSNVNLRIEALLEACEDHFEANRLLTGVGGTAVQCWTEVLALDPSNRQAIDGLNRVFARYLQWARSALSRGRMAKARGYVEKLERLNPEAPEIAELEEAIALFERHLEDGRAALAEGNLSAAQEHLDALKERYPNAPQVQELEAAIADALADATAVPSPEPTPEPIPEPAPEPAPEPPSDAERRVGEEFRDCDDHCPLMVVVPADSYEMGNSWLPNESPEHTVNIAEPFAVGVYEVTFEEWDACNADGGCPHNPSDNGWGRGRRPVINVSVEDALRYVSWLSRKTGRTYRLPSEAEWEYVARATKTTAYNWGSSFYVPGSKKANCADCGGRTTGRKTVTVGSFGKNVFGLYDVHGNVWERLEDCQQGTYDGAPQDGSVWRRGSCAFRAMRGGSWKDKAWDMRTSHRGWGPVDRRTDHAGFRVARSLDP